MARQPADAPKPPRRKPAEGTDPAIDAPPIPRPRHPRGAPAPAVVDTKAPAYRIESAPGWEETESDTSSKESPAAPPVAPWAVRVGIAVGVGALLLAVGAIGWVVGNAIVVALTTDGEDVAVEVPAQPNVPAFRGIGLEGPPGEGRTPSEEGGPGTDITPQRGRLLPAGPSERPSALRHGVEPAQAAPVNTQEVPGAVTVESAPTAPVVIEESDPEEVLPEEDYFGEDPSAEDGSDELAP